MTHHAQTPPIDENHPPRRWQGGHLLAHFRHQHNDLTQQQLADRIGRSRSSIAQIEAGTRTPSFALLQAISLAVPLSLEEQAMLFVAFEKVPPGPEHTLWAIHAVLHLDPALSGSHADHLSDQITEWYQAALS